MRIEKDHSSQIVAVWLTQEEKKNVDVAKELQKCFHSWKNEGFYPVVYCSGQGDLYEHTKGLLLYNQSQNV